jgi:uncharacterized protein DUF4833
VKPLHASFAVVGVCLAAAVAHAEPVRDIDSVFFVSKSENKNQVHYGVRLDERCVPAGTAPVFAYWRMLEESVTAREPLLAREQRAYGVLDQRVVARGESGGTIRLRLRAIPDRVIMIETSGQNGHCEARATLPITQTPAVLSSVHVKLRWPFGVDHLELIGRSLAAGGALREIIPG